jgi:hypothetical protein
VTPPRELVALAARETKPTAERTCCAHKRTSHERACCAKPVPKKVSSPIAWISPQAVHGCRGVANEWFSVPVSPPPAAPVRLPTFESLIQPLVIVTAKSPLAPSFTPPDPPPRIA